MLTKVTMSSISGKMWIAAAALLAAGILLVLYTYAPRVAAQDPSSLRTLAKTRRRP